MIIGLENAVAEFTRIVDEARACAAHLPCICVTGTVDEEENALARCTPCHLRSLFDETIEHAQGNLEYIQKMAANHPKEAARPTAAATRQRRSNVVKFHPLGKEPQPRSVWKP